jgi:uncharacterized membrane protein HdeD (DUF308 family)
MLDKAKRISTFLVIRGLLALVFGVLVLALPPAAVVGSLVMVFAIFAIVDGTFAVIGSLAGSSTYEDWWLLLVAGILGIVIGVFTLARPGVTAIVLVIYIGLRALLMGMMEIAFAVRLRKHIEGEWLYILAGGLSILFGLALIVYPIEGLLAVVWLIGIYAIAGGAMQLVLAGQVHHWIHRLEERQKPQVGKLA